MSNSLKQQTLAAILFLMFGGLMLGYELGNWLANGSWRLNGLLIIALCIIYYGWHLLRPVLKQLDRFLNNH